jgi:hypothetical protein
MKKVLTLLLYLSYNVVSAQNKTIDTSFLKNLLWEHASPQLKLIIQNPDSFHYQIIYTRIDRDKSNQPQFFNYYYHVDKDSYFNPASTVKMPLSFLALEKINHLKKYGVNKNTAMLTDSAYAGQTKVSQDTSSENNLPSIDQYIRKIFLISDNDAYNRLYEFLGQQYINERLWQMGYKDIRITRRFVPMNEDQNRHTNPIRFVENEKLLYTQASAYNNLPFDFSKKILIGKAHYDSQDSLIQSPMDFTTHNNLPLEDLQHILQSVLFPQSVPENQRFDLTKEDYQFLYQYMSEYPSESKYPHYDTSEYFNSYTKFFMFKSGKSTIPSYIRIFNKPGWSYGFLTDAAYIVDFKNKIEFMVSAVIYVNADGILNDDKYEYDETGYPFFKEVGDIIYQYELKRKRKYRPDLKKLQIHYK